MKWILAILLFVSASAIGQSDTESKYIRYQNQYGMRLPRFWADSVLRAAGLVKLTGIAASSDTTTNKPIAIDGSGNVVKFPHWPGGGGGNSGNFIIGAVAPTTEGSNGDYYFNQQTSQLYLKSAGSWGSPFAHIYSDTVKPYLTDRLLGPIIKHSEIWDTAGIDYNEGSWARNEDHGGNVLLTYKDDPVRVEGFNIDYGGNPLQSWKPSLFSSWESNFDTRQFGRPGFEWHWINRFIPGSAATAYSGGERLMSAYVAHGDYDGYLYWSFPEMWWQSIESPGAAPSRFMTANAGGLSIVRTFKLDSVYTGNDWLFLDGTPYGFRENSLNLPRMFFKRTGFLDTCTLRIGTGGDFVFQTNLGSGRTLFNLPIGAGLGSDGIAGGFSDKAAFQADQTGNLFVHKYDITDGTHSFNVSFHNDIYGIGLNTSANRQAYLDISNMAGRMNHNNYFTSNINNIDSAGNAINFIFERKYNGIFNSASLANGNGYALKLNTVSNFGTVFTNTQASNNEYTADFVWKSMYSTTMLERMRLTDTGYLYVKSLDTDLTPPATSGTTKMLVSDAGGLISNRNIPTYTIDALITTATNTGTSETDMYSKTIDANTLNADKQTLNIEIDGEVNDNTATAQIKLWFAGNTTLNTGAIAISTANTAWKIRAYIIRTSSSTAHVTYELDGLGLATPKFLGYSNLTSLDFTTTNILKITAQAGGAGGGTADITAHSWQVTWKSQP